MKIVSRMSVCRERIISEINMNQVNGAKHVTGTNLVPILAEASHLKDVQWDQSSPGNSASHYSDQTIIKLDFLVT